MAGSVKNSLEKIKHFCAYQERSHFEVKQKLYLLGLRTTDVEALLAKLIEENYLNEERFAQSFARGRFSLKKWGRVKIKHELTLKKVSATNIKTSLKEINEDDYQQTLQLLAEKKWLLLPDEQRVSKQAKTTQYLLQKGYELPLIQNILKIIMAKDK